MNKKLHGQRQAKVSVEGAASLKQDVPTKGGQGWGQDAVWEINEGALALRKGKGNMPM